MQQQSCFPNRTIKKFNNVYNETFQVTLSVQQKQQCESQKKQANQNNDE